MPARATTRTPQKATLVPSKLYLLHLEDIEDHTCTQNYT